MQTVIDTGNVKDRRSLRFNSIEEAITEANRLADCDRAAVLAKRGNWTLGQSLNHLGTWADYSFTGAPLKPPLFVKVFMRVVVGKRRFVGGPMRAGVKIPRVENGTLGTEVLPTDLALQKYCKAMERLKREAPTAPNVIFGPMTHDEWIQLNLRHSELHMSFFVPQ